MNKTLYYKFLNVGNNPYTIKDYEEVFEAIEKRKYFLDRLVGHVRGSCNGEFKDTDIRLIKGIADYLISNGLINLDKVESCYTTQNIDYETT